MGHPHGLLPRPGRPRLGNRRLTVRRRADWDGAWRLVTDGSDWSADEAVDVSVRFTARIPVRPVRLIAEGFGLSRAEVDGLIAEGNLVSAVRLRGKRSGDFGFLLKR